MSISEQKEILMNELKKYGINNEKELDEAIKKHGYVDIGIFVGNINDGATKK
jgi:hypothetical protein